MRILIFHIGSLGDTLISVPALWALKEHFNGALFTMLCDVQPGKTNVQVRDILDGSGLVDDYIFYPVDISLRGKLRQMSCLPGLHRELRRRRFDALVYLMRSNRPFISIQRDITFFRLAGIRQFIGQLGFEPLPAKIIGQPLSAVLHQTDQMLNRLAISCVRTPSIGRGKMDLKISDSEKNEASKWVLDNCYAKGKNRIAVAPGSKMPVKLWPVDRYIQVVNRLIHRFDVWPIIIGGSEDRQVGELMIKNWGRGSLAAGELSVRKGIAALQQCVFYLGNDTGVLHMAVTAGIPCIGIYSSRDYPGLWYPYGQGHKVFRTEIACEGCFLEVCKDRSMDCILSISVNEVYDAAEKLLQQSEISTISVNK